MGAVELMASTGEGHMSAGSSPVVDSDGHILEPADLWEQYLDNEYRDRAIRIVMDDEGRQHLLFDGMDSHQFLSAFGGVTADADRKADLMNPEKKLTYEDGFAPGSNDPKERLKVMDQDGI